MNYTLPSQCDPSNFRYFPNWYEALRQHMEEDMANSIAPKLASESSFSAVALERVDTQASKTDVTHPMVVLDALGISRESFGLKLQHLQLLAVDTKGKIDNAVIASGCSGGSSIIIKPDWEVQWSTEMAGNVYERNPSRTRLLYTLHTMCQDRSSHGQRMRNTLKNDMSRWAILASLFQAAHGVDDHSLIPLTELVRPAPYEFCPDALKGIENDPTLRLVSDEPWKIIEQDDRTVLSPEQEDQSEDIGLSQRKAGWFMTDSLPLAVASVGGIGGDNPDDDFKTVLGHMEWARSGAPLTTVYMGRLNDPKAKGELVAFSRDLEDPDVRENRYNLTIDTWKLKAGLADGNDVHSRRNLRMRRQSELRRSDSSAADRQVNLLTSGLELEGSDLVAALAPNHNINAANQGCDDALVKPGRELGASGSGESFELMVIDSSDGGSSDSENEWEEREDETDAETDDEGQVPGIPITWKRQGFKARQAEKYSLGSQDDLSKDPTAGMRGDMRKLSRNFHRINLFKHRKDPMGLLPLGTLYPIVDRVLDASQKHSIAWSQLMKGETLLGWKPEGSQKLRLMAPPVAEEKRLTENGQSDLSHPKSPKSSTFGSS